MEVRVFGVSGSPVDDGNVETFLSMSLNSIERPGVTIETASLSRYTIEDCRHCNYCWRKQTKERYCALDDDGQILFEKAESADILVLATPVYFMRSSARMASFIDRLRLFIFGNITKKKLRNKVGVSLVVGWMRHAGMETTHLNHLLAFGILEMIAATSHDSISPLGGSALSSEHGMGRFDSAVRLGTKFDKSGLESGRMAMERALELATILKRGMECDANAVRR
jgi:multimeric flavodoxin WrbA